ncbi:MAG TPA: GAF domain-containing protein [Verrucomicrobiae bacterium]|jgi:GAF domain-containing protein
MNELPGQIVTLLQSGQPREIVLEKVLRETLKQFHSDTGTIHRLHETTQLLRLIAQVGLPPQLLDMVTIIPVGKGIAGQVIAQNKPVSICNLQTDSSGIAKPGAKQTGVGGALCVPIRNGDKTVGTIGIGTIRQHEYTPDETRELEEIGRLIGRELKL